MIEKKTTRDLINLYKGHQSFQQVILYYQVWVSLEELKKELLELKKEVYNDYKRDLPDVMKESKKEQILFKEYFKGYLDAIDYLINERLFGEATTDIGDCITNPRNSSVVAPKNKCCGGLKK